VQSLNLEFQRKSPFTALAATSTALPEPPATQQVRGAYHADPSYTLSKQQPTRTGQGYRSLSANYHIPRKYALEMWRQVGRQVLQERSAAKVRR